MRTLATRLALVLFSSACGTDAVCVSPPCPLSVAIQLSVTATGGGVVNGFVVKVTGPNGSLSCEPASSPTGCFVAGYRGQYQLDIGAPGFQSVQRSVQVFGSDAGCNTCAAVNTMYVAVTLSPASSASPFIGRSGRSHNA